MAAAVRELPPDVLIIDLIDARGQSHRLVGRAAAMVGLIVVYQERLNASTSGHLTIHFSGRSLKPDFMDHLTGA